MDPRPKHWYGTAVPVPVRHTGSAYIKFIEIGPGTDITNDKSITFVKDLSQSV